MMKRFLFLLTLIPLLLFLVACGGAESTQPATEEDAAPTEEAGAEEESGAEAASEALVDTAWVKDHLDDPNVHLIDVSSKRESYEEGHLPGAPFVNWQKDLTNPDDPVNGQILTSEQLSALMSELGVKNDDTVVFYDDTSNLFATRAYWVLKYYQHENVHVFDGGTKKWVADGEELTTEAATPGTSDYQAGEPDPAIATDWEYVVDHLEDPSTIFCDTRSPDEYIGTDVRADQGGHVPGAVNLEWTVAVNDDGTFKDREALAELYEKAGFTPDKEIITYCQTGVRGAHTWFVLTELLGYPNVRNYDGSWAEYGNREDSPIEQ